MKKNWVISELKKCVSEGETIILKKSIETRTYNGYFNGLGDYDDEILSIHRVGNTFFCNTTKHNGNERELLKFESYVVYFVAWQLLSDEQREKIALKHLYETANWCSLKFYT